MLNAIFFYRISRWLYLHHVPFLPKLITLLIFLMYNSKVPFQAKIGRGTKLGYGGMGVVIHSKATIGDYCTIGQQVTIGGEFPVSRIARDWKPCDDLQRSHSIWGHSRRRQCDNRGECRSEQTRAGQCRRGGSSGSNTENTR